MNRKTGVLTAMTLCLLLTGGQPALAGLDVDLGARVRVGDDADLFVSITSRYFNRDSQVVADMGRRYSNPDDLSVALFLTNRTRRDPADVWRFRERGLSWWEIGVRLGVPAEAWFVPVQRHPGPPYGKAYGHWKNGKNSGYRMTDADARNLVAVRMIHEYYNVPVSVAMEWRASGQSVRTLMNKEYRQRHGKVASHKAHGKQGKQGKGHGKKK
ncbi:MAG: hypothetical protein IFK94_00425 [Acidobacteria bacterium]|uniref:Uncharacterized protein n=1 Tax=Candidatus Polarisedimenticola svalbardensis TaxID=2886004 RepID=A0A8J6XWY3_9BACT|nr:hypothetical protein [Candidatus Polarisedimenticola svalbardensis]